MAHIENGHTNGFGDSAFNSDTVPSATRFSDIPSAIDIPASTFDSEVEVSLEELPDDPTELCTLLENEKAAKNFWVIISLAYAKQNQLDHAIEILQKGLASVAHGATKEKLGLLNWLCWLLMIKSRQAPRVAPDGDSSGVKTKDYYLQQATSTLNEASRLNPAYTPLFLARGVLSLLRASLYPPRPVRAGIPDTSERVESLRQALKCFEEASKASGGRNVMAHLGLARAQYSLGNYAEALLVYQTVLTRMPGLTDPDPRIGIGCCLWQLGFKERAKDAWERALSLNPKSKVASILVGTYYLYSSSQRPTSDPQFGELYRVSMTHTQGSLKLDKDYPMACARFAGYKLIRKDYKAVEVLARKAIEQTDVVSIASEGWYLLGRKAHYEGDTAKASEYFNRSDQARGGGDSGFLPAKFGVVQMQVKSKDLDGAKFRLEKIIQQSKNPECMALLGALLAEDVFSAQASGSKDDKSADATKAISLLESVRSLWKDPTKNIPPDESVLIYLSRLYESTSPEKSMQCLTQLEEIQMEQIPDQERPHENLQNGELKAALREHLPPQLLNNIGCFLYQSGKVAQARELFQSALTACDKSEEVEGEKATDALLTTIRYNFARCLEALDLPDEAKKVYESLLERHGDYTEASARMTYIALRQSPTDEGPKKMAKLYERDSTNLEVRALFGWYLSKSKKRVANLAEDHEQRHYKHTLQHFDKHDRYALTGMGNVHLLTARDMRRETDADKEKRRKMYERAVEFFDKALQLDPKNAYAAQGIAIALVDDRKDFAGAVQIFSKIRDTIKDASVYLNLGHAYAELKQFTRSIECYETALSKDRARDAQLLACLGRVWWLRGKHEKNLTAMKTALDYANRALAVAPEQAHLEFNVAFVQNQVALLVNSLPETQRTLQDLQEAAEGLEKAIETFTRIAQVKTPPYPRESLEQRANMGRNTISKQLERSIQNQKEYEDKNALKLQQARAAREAELKRREEEVRKAQELENERKRRLAEERQRIIEETQRLAAKRAEEQRAREAAELTTDSETGERQKRKRKASSGRRRKRRDEDDGVVSDGRSISVARSDDDGTAPAPKRRRRLERRGGAKEKLGKYKSSELVVDSDEELENEAAAIAKPAGADDDKFDSDGDLFGDDDNVVAEEEEEATTPAANGRGGRARRGKRVVDDSDEDEDEPAAAVSKDTDDEEMQDTDDE
ncbi:RNA polymerase II transcription elongation factor (Ctr9), putative [Talaromyces stipitatus ATCC 10500]|uniref:RNA polymerase II transcription elongation factor (Ctr9), putative n=1 Tax=Talaromyces stipitatus (strain ATCC 10500 / CBS 375.48 / QM 6759 / NRRL 1006) TaxID=441959 RepID=B8MC16_TALSN|nr:RNA polymerase II transcription elongation factor (Ctr9), putative [Talaromyces stipitatus ATCC 10500]EED18462.1 RNA polymerase II transcription elongation factor (Ctr9), putative [Talaromyces stipitatus ATCC 10500]